MVTSSMITHDECLTNLKNVYDGFGTRKISGAWVLEFLTVVWVFAVFLIPVIVWGLLGMSLLAGAGFYNMRAYLSSMKIEGAARQISTLPFTRVVYRNFGLYSASLLCVGANKTGALLLLLIGAISDSLRQKSVISVRSEGSTGRKPNGFVLWAIWLIIASNSVLVIIISLSIFLGRDLMIFEILGNFTGKTLWALGPTKSAGWDVPALRAIGAAFFIAVVFSTLLYTALWPDSFLFKQGTWKMNLLYPVNIAAFCTVFPIMYASFISGIVPTFYTECKDFPISVPCIFSLLTMESKFFLVGISFMLLFGLTTNLCARNVFR